MGSMRSMGWTRWTRWTRWIFSFGLFLATLELILALWPGLLPPSLGNAVYGRYHCYPGGMYFAPEGYNMTFLRPDRTMIAYWNGYRWHHHTDHRGFRNPDSWTDPIILLLGDSMIYGHGVEVEDTVGYQLRKAFGHPTYIMARQGDFLYQEYVLMRLYAEELRPRQVVLFVFQNDFFDLLSQHTPDQLQDPPEINRYDYAALHHLVTTQQGYLPPGLYRQYLRLRSLRLLDAVIHQTLDAMAADNPAMVPLDRSQLHLASRYNRTLLVDLQQRLAAQGARLLVVHLVIDSPDFNFDGSQRQIGRVLRAICREENLDCASTRGIFEHCSGCFLPNDGHFTAEGHRRLAQFLDPLLD